MGMDVEGYYATSDRKYAVEYSVPFRDMKNYFTFDPHNNGADLWRVISTLKIGIDFGDCYAWQRGLDCELYQEFWGYDHGTMEEAVMRVAYQIATKGTVTI